MGEEYLSRWCNAAYGSEKKIYRLSRPVIGTITPTSKAFTVKWGKNAKASGYQIEYSTSSKFTTNDKTITVTGATRVSKKITKLLGAKRYYVRVRAYKRSGTGKYCSGWSAVKKVITKN